MRPLLVPVGLDPSHPFPQVANKSLNFIARLAGKDAFGRRNTVDDRQGAARAAARDPAAAARARRKGQSFVLLTSVIRAHLGSLFPGREVEAFSQFRITRDSDLEVDADVTNLRQALRSGLTTRHFGQAVRLEVVNTCPAELSQFLLQQFGLAGVGAVQGQRAGQPGADERADRPRRCAGAALRAVRARPGRRRLPRAAADVRPHPQRRRCCCTSRSSRSSRWSSSCARRSHDPDVLAIKQTIYRAGSVSPLMDLLIEAARRGKEVMAVVELKARFDEEANINWAERLEAVGAQVVYGVVGLKTHAKLLLVTRREDGRPEALRAPLDRQLQPEHGAPLHRPRLLQRRRRADRRRRRRVPAAREPGPDAAAADAAAGAVHAAQADARPASRAVAEAAAAGRTARIVVKINALTDVAADRGAGRAPAQAGAEIDLIVRGACMLPPGHRRRRPTGSACARSSAASSSIRASPTSAGATATTTRRSTCRAPTGWAATCSAGSRSPGRCATRALRQRVIDECLVPYLHDSKDAWLLRSDGSYERVADGGQSAQQALMRLHGAEDAGTCAWT